ncbi:FBD-associated F-box protein At5g56370-like isoform X1 [Silene latifolia]|uniref:FBD-associated F-box protein At5g56370-like isoform X1 n=1 Tax=Silene latifolia TaxID=37657 RepID=UPI003D77EF1D
MNVGKKTAEMQRGNVDRISDLPDFILHDILLIPDTKEAGRTSVLSKKWYRAWSSILVLVFQPRYFKIDVCKARNDESEDDKDKLQRFVKFVDGTMLRYSILEFRIRKMYLEVLIVDEQLVNLVDTWIKIAVLNQIEELEIQIHGNIDYVLPEFLFCAKSLKVLKCRRIELPYYEIMELVSLTHLTLEPISVDEDMLQRIISSCPLVELDITHKYLDEVSLPWTRKVDGRVEGCDSGTMQSNLQESPLQKFVFCSNRVYLPWPWKMNAMPLKNLKTVEISCATITDDIVYELTNGLISLEKLVLNSCVRLKYIKISSLSLKDFQIHDSPDFMAELLEVLLEVTLDTPNLLEFKYNCKVETSLSLIRVLDRCNAQFSPFMFDIDILDTDWFVELKQFLKDTKLFKSLEMNLWHVDPIVVEEDQLRSFNTGPPYKLSELMLVETCLWDSVPYMESSLTTFLDALFWCCHPDVLSITTNSEISATKSI